MILFFGMTLVKEKLLSLKGNRRVIIDTLLKNAQKHLFLDIEEIARELKTTPSTLSRIVRAVGFKNFKDFRTWIAKKSGFFLETDELAIDSDERILEDELNGVKAIFSAEMIKTISEAADLIAGRKSLIIAGFGPFYPLGEILKENISSTDIQTHFVKNSKHEALTLYHQGGSDTALFTVNMLQAFQEAVELLKIFKARQIPTITLTNIPFSQIGMLSSIVIPVKLGNRHPVFPMAAAIACIDLLAMKIANLKKSEIRKKQKTYEQMILDKDLISEPD